MGYTWPFSTSITAHDLGGAYHNADTEANLLTKLSDVSAFGEFKCGSYTGDGSTDQGITGVGFQPDFVWIIVDANDEGMYLLTSDMSSGNYFIDDQAGGNTRNNSNQIISLDSDGFSVDDAGADAHPNKNGQTYYYICAKESS